MHPHLIKLLIAITTVVLGILTGSTDTAQEFINGL